jgi:rhomboid protease GluP
VEQPATRGRCAERRLGLNEPGSAEHTEFGRSLAEATPTLWVTHAIVAANVLVFLAMLVDGAGLVESNSAVHLQWGANFGPLTKEGQWWRLPASTFLHFGVFHLAMNMWALWSAGRLSERLYGNGALVAIYLFAGLTGSFVSLLWNADKVVSAGASGAIFGVYGSLAAYVLCQPGSVPRSVMQSLKGSMLAFVAYAVVLGALVSAIDNAAHVGGLAGGFALGCLLSRPLAPRPPLTILRAAGATGVSALALASLYSFVSPPAYSYSAQQAAVAAIQQFATDETALAARATALVGDRKAGRLTDRQLGEAIEKDLVPGWTAAHARFTSITLDPAAPAAEKLRALTELVGVRRDMFQEYAAGLKTGDPARIRTAEGLSATSLRMTKAIRERAGAQ